MDGKLKALVGAACIAILAIAVHYFYSAYTENEAAKTEEEAALMMRQCRKSLSASGIHNPVFIDFCAQKGLITPRQASSAKAGNFTD